jgi:hypothetical protein
MKEILISQKYIGKLKSNENIFAFGIVKFVSKILV